MKGFQDEIEVLEKAKNMLTEGKMIKDGVWDKDDIILLNKHLFLSSKPQLYLINIDRDEYVNKEENPWIPKIRDYLKEKNNQQFLSYSAQYEKEITEEAGEDDEMQALLAKENGAE